MITQQAGAPKCVRLRSQLFDNLASPRAGHKESGSPPGERRDRISSMTTLIKRGADDQIQSNHQHRRSRNHQQSLLKSPGIASGNRADEA
jgi:hypothetical protein